MLEARRGQDELGKPKAFRIDSVEVAPSGGRIGMTICPGHSGRPDLPNRNLRDDLTVIRAWRPDAIVTLMETHEFELIAVEELPRAMTEVGIDWYHLPIVDAGIPDEGFHALWATVGPTLRGIISHGGRVLLHCRGGIGRSGTVGAQLLIELGAAPDEAIREVRAARPGAIENRIQEDYLFAMETAAVRSRGGGDG